MSKSVYLKDIEPFIEEILENGGSVSFMPNGQSMMPLIREGQDSVIISPLLRKPQKYDAILYKRTNGQFVLHRIVKVKKNSYVLCGDNQFQYEYNVTDSMIIGLMTALKRDGQTVTPDNKEYAAYLKRLYARRVVKRIRYYTRRALSKIKRTVLGAKK